MFLNGRVAVVVMGSVEIRNHSEHKLLKPNIIKKAIEGDIIGSEINEDSAIMLSPMTWSISM